MSTPININNFRARLLGPSDLPLLIELGLPTCGFMHGRENISESELKKHFTKFVQEFALEPSSEIYLLENESKEVVGQIWLHITKNRFNGLKELWIWDITVHPSHRRQGIGRHLMHLAEQRAIEHKCDELWLLVSERNEEARQLYEELGLETQGRLLAKSLKKAQE
jgi:ribosomal protein S18 acetylase RimI-like enzyme